MQLLAALLLLLLSVAVAPSFASSPIDPAAEDDENAADDIDNPRALFERSYFQLPAHLREAARADLGGVDLDRGLYSVGEEKNKKRKRKTKTKKDKEASSSAEEKKTTSTSTSSSSSAATAAAAAAAAAFPAQAAAGDQVKVMIVQPDAQQMEAIMRGEQVK